MGNILSCQIQQNPVKLVYCGGANSSNLLTWEEFASPQFIFDIVTETYPLTIGTMILKAVLAILSFTAVLNTEKFGVFFEIEEDSFFVDKDAFWIGKVDSLLSCSQMCAREAVCKSGNYITSLKTCSLHRETRKIYPDRLLRQKGSYYVEKLSSEEPLASYSFQNDSDEIPTSHETNQPPILSSCWAISFWDPLLSSGVYWIDPSYGSKDDAFQVYCDMDTDDGGWTLVWSYTFTNYSHFSDQSNAITPRPNWPSTQGVDVPISTTTPLSEMDYNAMEFSRWKQIGSEILIKSNIDNWWACFSLGGSLINWQYGTAACAVVSNVTGTCLYDDTRMLTIAPGETCGPKFLSEGAFYHFDGCTQTLWPIHDPCGASEENNLKHVINPHGSVFIR